MEMTCHNLEFRGVVVVEGINPRWTYFGVETRNLETSEPELETYIYFFGIPYAVPPLGNLRFKVFRLYLEFTLENIGLLYCSI